MNLAAIDWQMIGTVFVALGFIYTILRNNRRDIRDQFTAQQNYIEKIDKKVEALFDKSDKKVEALFDKSDKKVEALHALIIDLGRNIGSDMSDIKERLSFLESAMMYTMPLEPQINARSQAAREMWKRRKQKKLDKKD
jgi:predicted transcriptional regulator